MCSDDSWMKIFAFEALNGKYHHLIQNRNGFANDEQTDRIRRRKHPAWFRSDVEKNKSRRNPRWFLTTSTTIEQRIDDEI
jgi:hypothetical protein